MGIGPQTTPDASITMEAMSEIATPPRILNGITIAEEIKKEVAADVARLSALGIRPGLAAVLVGHVPASEIYVRSKVKTCADLGLYSDLITPPGTITTEEMQELVAALNTREDIDGILLQLPLPPQVDAKQLLAAVAPEKDVDGFHPVSVGRLQTGQSAFAPCTAIGIIEMLKRSDISIGFVTPDMVRPGATVIDVGMNRVTDRAQFEHLFGRDSEREENFLLKGSTLVGDVHPAAFAVSGAYSPVPGGVGKLTIAMLMANTVRAARLRRGLAD
jgi:methylenetetrahydrofolate dehydrogenase (NADP+)/methenyltetrahydrofolate cyclohydrolase